MNTIRNLISRGVDEGIFPGAVTLVANKGQVVFLDACGRARLVPERPMTTDTVFDLASLTKPLATAVSLMLLVQEDKVGLDETLATAIPDFLETDKLGITVRQLLSHTAGIPAYRPYYQPLSRIPGANRKSLLKELLVGENLSYEPGTACVYSDLGFMILEWLVKVAAKRPLDRFVRDSICDPLKLKDLFFVPLNSAKGKKEHIYAATEDCPWRSKTLEGEVHDENAYALGGVAGHAGLFGTALDVYVLLQELLNVYLGKENRGIFHQDVVQTFFRRHSDLGSWALGFDTPTRPGSSSGRHFSDRSVGHLGFTGTSFWMDLEQEVILVLLTNRVHPTRANENIKDFRPLLHDTVVEAIGSNAPPNPAM
jgi:CubicO group peptidase (beta-lactamase class C family)